MYKSFSTENLRWTAVLGIIISDDLDISKQAHTGRIFMEIGVTSTFSTPNTVASSMSRFCCNL